MSGAFEKIFLIQMSKGIIAENGESAIWGRGKDGGKKVPGMVRYLRKIGSAPL
jgi:hypothetical protein